jgi:dolichyl-diphosphooligosaccharide--protein glycosyltransferase
VCVCVCVSGRQGVAIFALLLTYWLWVRAVNTGSLFMAAMASLAYFYMASAWGGA